LRFKGEAFRAHDPRWSWTPHSGKGAALAGRRFNWKGLEALYMSLDPVTALSEVSGGFAHRLEPLVLCTYDIDCDDLVDLRTEADRERAGIGWDDLACAWAEDLMNAREPASHAIVRRLIAEGAAGIVVPSFAHRASPDDHNIVLWDWGPTPPHKVTVFDPSGRLPKDQLSWR
jgi:RES domain-containing protein